MMRTVDEIRVKTGFRILLSWSVPKVVLQQILNQKRSGKYRMQVSYTCENPGLLSAESAGQIITLKPELENFG